MRVLLGFGGAVCAGRQTIIGMLNARTGSALTLIPAVSTRAVIHVKRSSERSWAH